MSASPPPAPLTYDVNDLTAEDFYGYWPLLWPAATALALFTLAAAVVAWITERTKAYRYIHIITWVPEGVGRAGGRSGATLPVSPSAASATHHPSSSCLAGGQSSPRQGGLPACPCPALLPACPAICPRHPLP